MKKQARSLAVRLTRTTGLQLILVAGSLSILGFSVGQNNVIEQKESHRTHLPVIRVSERLSSKISFLTIINQLNEEAIAADPELLKDFDKLSLRFWRQLRSFPVDYINYGSEDGSFIGIEKSAEGSFFHNEDSARLGRGKMFVFSMNPIGQRHRQEDVIPGMSTTHQEAWYVDTVKAGKPTWSKIYAWEDQPDTFSISYNAPIFNQEEKLIGVVGVDMLINKLSNWLQEAWKDQSGLALIVEKNGDIVASSEPKIVLVRSGKIIRRANTQELKNPVAKSLSSQFFSQKNGKAFIDVNNLNQELVKIPDQTAQHFVLRATPWGQEFGLDWFLITGTSVDQEVSTTERNLILMIFISIAALLTALAINRRLINALLTPLGALTSASQSTEHQITDSTEQPELLSFNCELQKSGTKEFSDLHQAITAMVTAFNKLTQDLKQKEKQIIGLFQDKQEKDERALSVMSKKLKTSLEAGSIAHEINQPLSILKLTSQSLINSLDNNKSPNSSDLTHQLSTINSQSERIVLITNKVRALLRNAQTEFSEIDLKQVIQSSLLYINSNNPDSHTWINSQQIDSIADSSILINGDAVQLQIALINILKNSIESLHQPNNPDPLILVRLKDIREYWSIEIEDNGEGLLPEIIEESLMKSSKPDGTGLGLFIARSAIESHNGHLSLLKGSSGGLLAQLNLPKNH
ncbi:ATP-binding protein [Synechococcus sp. WH 8016]|uniref:ATP-binding protein n=1 Tax=Synechococcus sp. WH 8016 TaxID=166318 RepID=UPI00022D9EF3|nr:ATP-binding protein [Synechococcus sp. WH 8016]EHA60233.1 integral membrane sensor signal transduction histidine kinase [Synechococcus sp. WH 8016]